MSTSVQRVAAFKWWFDNISTGQVFTRDEVRNLLAECVLVAGEDGEWRLAPLWLEKVAEQKGL